MISSPPFGQADLTNCERELIHLTGSVQPHGLLFVLGPSPTPLTINRVSRNVSTLLATSASSLLNQQLDAVGGDVATQVRQILSSTSIDDPVAIKCAIDGAPFRQFEGTLHRLPAGPIILELEPLGYASVPTVDLDGNVLVAQIEAAIRRFSVASTIERLTDEAVRCYRELIGYDRVMVYKFDPDGHGLIVAESRDAGLDSLLGHHYPATDIPQRARELYLRNKLRVLVDAHYVPSPLEPIPSAGATEDLDLSMSYLRSMSPLHLQYLKNMGVTATLVVSLVREDKLWGLIACHHYSPRNVRLAVRAAADLMAEVLSTRIAAIESFAQAQVAIQVRRLEQRLVEATSVEGDWRMALLRNPRALLQPLSATGAALFYDGEVLTAGDVPSTPQLRDLLERICEEANNEFFHSSSISRTWPKLAALTPTASGILAARLSSSRPDYLMWFRREQLQTVTWAGDPSKPMIGNDPLELSPRRSFAAWSEIVRDTAVRWSDSELATARAFSAALVNIIVQINSVRILIAENHLGQVRSAIGDSRDAVIIVDQHGAVLFTNRAFLKVARHSSIGGQVDELFVRPEEIRRLLSGLSSERQSWHGEHELARGDGSTLAVAVRAEVVPARNGSIMGFFLIVSDLTDSNRTAAARQQFERTLSVAGFDPAPLEGDTTTQDRLMNAILSSASVAAMDIADGGSTPSTAPLLRELETSTRRVTTLYQRIRNFTGLT